MSWRVDAVDGRVSVRPGADGARASGATGARRFSAPCVWDSGVLDGYERLNERYGDRARVVEVYGSHASSRFGSGRAAMILPRVGDAAVFRWIRAARRRGFSFSYLLNAACLGGDEGTYSGQRELRALLGRLADAGADRVTVTSPLVMEFARACEPGLKVGASVICYVDSVRKLEFFAGLGVDRVTLDIDVTRNFPLLRALRASTGLELGLIVNSLCLLGCPLKAHHYNLNAHFSRPREPGLDAGSALSHVGARCMIQNHEDKVRALMSAWIRPEDLGLYTQTGIDHFKIQGRGARPENLLKTVETYLRGESPAGAVPLTAFAGGRTGFRVKARAMTGFLDHFLHTPYRCQEGCGPCRYCHDWAERVVTEEEEGDVARQVVASARTMAAAAVDYQARIDALAAGVATKLQTRRGSVRARTG